MTYSTCPNDTPYCCGEKNGQVLCGSSSSCSGPIKNNFGAGVFDGSSGVKNGALAAVVAIAAAMV